jgi:quinol monooxygenase YgiN
MPDEIAVIAEVRAKAGEREALLTAIGQVLSSVAGEQGCEQYVVHTDDGDPDVVWFYERYRDPAARAEHGASDAIGELRRALGDLIAAAPRIVAMHPVMDKDAGR